MMLPDEEMRRDCKRYRKYYRNLLNSDEESQLFSNVCFKNRVVESVSSPKPGDWALDLGCGDGELAVQLNRLGFKTTGLDLIKNSAWEARRESVSKGLFFREGAFLATRFEKKYHLIIDHLCFYHQHPWDHLKWLSKAAGLLEQSGRLLLVVGFLEPNRKHEWKLDKNSIIENNYSASALGELFRAAGLRLESARLEKSTKGQQWWIVEGRKLQQPLR